MSNRKVIIWDNFLTNKENFKNSPYFMLNQDLSNYKAKEAKQNIASFISDYNEHVPLCGTNKESFKGVSNNFSFWHYHCGLSYNKQPGIFYNNKECFDKTSYKIIKEKACVSCLEFDSKLGREGTDVIYYVKFYNTEIIGIVGYGLEHNPFLEINAAPIQAVLKAKMQDFREI